ncbi:MAG: hypothetical protein Q4G43_08270 [Mobilicoccus sp.]|nr:hypothetical protein [Mobilicoccus sp.]
MTQPLDRTPDPERTGQPFDGERDTVDEQDLIDGDGNARPGKKPAEQSPGHAHDNPDTPDEVHPALKADE